MDLLGQNRGWFSDVKNFTVPLQYPRKTKYLQHFFRISLKKKSFSAIERKFYLRVIKGYIEYPSVKHLREMTISTESKVRFFIRPFFEVLIDIVASVKV